MRNFSSFVSWSITFIISLYILRTFGEPASVNLGQPKPEDQEGENYVESDRPESSLHYFIFGGEPAPHKEGHSENDKADESCTKNETKIDPKVAEDGDVDSDSDDDNETNVESVEPFEHLNVRAARQVVAPPPAQEGQQNQQNQQNRTNNNLKGPSYTVGNGGKIGSNNNDAEDQLPKTKNPLDAILEISDPAMRNSMTAFYGSVIGDADCGKKFTCLLGNAVEGFPGRDYFFMFAGRYVPSDWSVLYDIFRISSLYGQNCELYLCQPKHKQ